MSPHLPLLRACTLPSRDATLLTPTSTGTLTLLEIRLWVLFASNAERSTPPAGQGSVLTLRERRGDWGGCERAPGARADALMRETNMLSGADGSNQLLANE